MASKKRPVPEINAGSMADIAFLLLIFFLVTTTMDVDKGLLVKLPPWTEESSEEQDIKEKNIFVVLVNAQDQLLIEEEYATLEDVAASLRNLLTTMETAVVRIAAACATRILQTTPERRLFRFKTTEEQATKFLLRCGMSFLERIQSCAMTSLSANLDATTTNLAKAI